MQQKILHDCAPRDWQADLLSFKEERKVSKNLYAIPCKMIYPYRWADNVDDLKGAALEGLAVALCQFDQERHKAFLSYVRKVIQGFIVNEQRAYSKRNKKTSLGLETAEIDKIKQDEHDPEKDLIAKQLSSKINFVLKNKISFRQASVVMLAFGLGSGKEMTVASVARCLNMPYFATRQMLNEALCVLREELNDCI
jgi:RNA polymerase sigma factor (sigma-70 family)